MSWNEISLNSGAKVQQFSDICKFILWFLQGWLKFRDYSFMQGDFHASLIKLMALPVNSLVSCYPTHTYNIHSILWRDFRISLKLFIKARISRSFYILLKSLQLQRYYNFLTYANLYCFFVVDFKIKAQKRALKCSDSLPLFYAVGARDGL